MRDKWLLRVCRSRGRPEWPTNTQRHAAVTACRASRAITDLFHGLASKLLEKVKFLHYTYFLSLSFCFSFFAAMLKWSLKLVSCRTKYESLSVCHTSLQSRVPNTILKFHETETEKVSSCHAKKEESYVPCSFLTSTQARNSFKNGLAFRDSLVLRHTKKTTAELTERVSDVLGGVPRRRFVTEKSEAPSKRKAKIDWRLVVNPVQLLVDVRVCFVLHSIQ